MKLVLLDIGLPGIDGFEVCRRIDGRVPVIMLTARDEEPDRVAGLELGADDYVAKPFSPRELTARVKAVLRRAGQAATPEDVTALGPLTLARGAREVRVDGREIELTQREFDLLEYLVRHAGQVVTRDELLESVWGFLSPGRDPHRRGARGPAAQEARPPGPDPDDPWARVQGGRVTLRRRVLAYVALAATASCALTVVVAVALVRHRVASQQMTALERQTDVVAAIGDVPGVLGPGAHVYGVGNGTPRRLGARRAAAVLAAIGASGNSRGTITVGGRDLLYVARSTPAGQVVLVRGAGLAFAQWRPFLWSLIIAGLGGALLAAALSFLLARRLTRPIGELAAATGRVAAGQTGVRVPVRGDDELAGLGRAFNEMSRELGSRPRGAAQLPRVGEP